MSEPTVGSVIDGMTPKIKRAFIRILKATAGMRKLSSKDKYICETEMSDDERKVTYFLIGEIVKLKDYHRDIDDLIGMFEKGE